MKKNAKPVIVFDMDGVLIDSMPLHIKTFVKLAHKFSGMKIKEKNVKELYLKTAGISLGIQFKKLFRKENINFTENNIKILEKEFFKTKLESKQKIFKGAKKLLLKLKRNSYFLAVSSGCSQKITSRTIKKAGLKKYFNKIFGSSSFFSKEKGHFEKLKKISKKIYFVADGTQDMEIARKKNLIGIGITTTFSAQALKKAGAKYVYNKIEKMPLNIFV